ncbi:extensin [Rothia sp. (in: high G+C Gram-positive bacteria)]|uniref:extensin n=1 Tax=Rothia sp. (in: high G+C Gram-positive bacteria) TaxID=1885016 RepID=UPI001CADF0AF|nr:extensin [Rothia sp. (in: high G+C Gram-positive bacteria)]MBF1654758.1 extensin [Rothia sp. (in: high G+C Gram-positive bacteria)]
MITGPTVAPIGDLSNSAGPTAGTISVELEEMPAIADGLDAVSRTCADRTMPILGIATETRLFLGINGRAQQAAAICAVLAADLGMSAAKFGVTAATVRAAHSSYLQVENTVAGWFESMGIAKDGKLPDGRSTRGHFRGLIAGEPGEATYLLKLTIPELGYFSASRTLPYSPLVAGILFGFTAYMDAKWNPEIARQRAFDRLASMFGIPRGLARKALGGGLSNLIKAAIGGNAVYNVRTASAEEYGIATHRGEKNQLSVGASSERLLAAAQAQDLELERSRQDPLTAERSAVLVTVMYEAGHEGDPAHALYVVSIPGTIFGSWGGSIIDGEGTLREAAGPDQMNSAYMMILQALRDAGAPKGARVYMEGFSQGAMIAHNMANSAEVAKEINIVGVYAQAAPMRGMSAKQRDFAVDYVEGDGDGVPDIAKKIPLPQIFGEPWHPDERDTVITVNNHEHHAVNYHEALHREGHSGKVPGGMRAAMDGKEYVLGEQKVTSASNLPDGLPPALRVGITIKRTEGYAVAALASGTIPGGLGIVEGIDQLTGGRLGQAKRGIEDTVSDVQQGMEIAKQRAEGLQREAGETVQAAAKQIPAVIEGVKKTLPHPEPTPQEKPQNPKPAWPETPVPQMPNSRALPAPNLAPAQPVLSAAKLLGSNTEAPANRGFIVNAPQDTQPVSRMPMTPAEDIDPGFIVRPEAQPALGNLAPRLIQGLPDVVESLPRIGDLTAMPHVVGGDRQGGDYDGSESLIPTLPDLKPAPMLPPKSIDPGFLAPTPPENIDPGFRAPGPPEDLTPIEEREPLMV